MHLTMKRKNKLFNRIRILLDITYKKKKKKKKILLDIHSKEAYPRNLLKKKFKSFYENCKCFLCPQQANLIESQI